MNYLFTSLIEISNKLQSGLLTASELCEMCYKRVEHVSKLNAFITLNEQNARLQAAAADTRRLKGKPLSVIDGIPIAVKDNFSTKDIRTTCASRMLTNYYPPYNATVVQRLLDAGAIVIGKTNMDEFAMGSGTTDSLYGPTQNVWQSGLRYNLVRRFKEEHNHKDNDKPQETLDSGDFFTCGGSSGGSAIAVATGSCFGAIGSDTGGSTRNPAAMCGIVGLKPTYGLVSRHGLIPLCNSLDVPGILTKTVDDAALLLGHIAGFDPLDSTTSSKTPFVLPDTVTIKNLHFGIPKEYNCAGMSSEITEIWKRTADLLDSAGAKVSEVSLPHTEYSIICYSVLCCCDVASNFARYDGIEFGHRTCTETSAEHLFASNRHEGFGEVVRGRILAGNYFLLKNNYEEYYIQAAKVRQLICDDFTKVFENGINLLLTPVTLTDAVPYSEWKQLSNREHNATDDFCTQPVNMAGLPAVSIPVTLSKKGLPISLQLIGQPFRDEVVLAAAKWIEQKVNCLRLDLDVKEIISHQRHVC